MGSSSRAKKDLNHRGLVVVAGEIWRSLAARGPFLRLVTHVTILTARRSRFKVKLRPPVAGDFTKSAKKKKKIEIRGNTAERILGGGGDAPAFIS